MIGICTSAFGMSEFVMEQLNKYAPPVSIDLGAKSLDYYGRSVDWMWKRAEEDKV